MKPKRSVYHDAIIAFAVFIIVAVCPAAEAAGLFGAPQTISRKSGGINTAVGYVFHDHTYENGSEHVIRQNEIFSHAAYGSKNIWEIYARIGLSDFKMPDAFTSTDAAVVTLKNDFKENWKISGTLGAKAFYPVGNVFGVGAFVQGTYYFSDIKDAVSGTDLGVPFIAELKMKNVWDVTGGAAVQLTVLRGIRFYAGPYFSYSEATISLAPGIPGMDYSTGKTSIRNKSLVGGFAGLNIPLAKGFRLNIEAQVTDRISAGAAISFSY